MSEYIFVTRGFAREPVWCHVVIASGKGRQAVLIGELEDNPGTSATNALEQIAEKVSAELLKDRQGFEFFEYVPKGLPSLEPTFYRIEWGGTPGRFSMPVWNVVAPETDWMIRFFRGRVLPEGYTSKALMSARDIDVFDAREHPDIPGTT